MRTLRKCPRRWLGLAVASSRIWIEPEWSVCPAARGLDLWHWRLPALPDSGWAGTVGSPLPLPRISGAHCGVHDCLMILLVGAMRHCA